MRCWKRAVQRISPSCNMSWSVLLFKFFFGGWIFYGDHFTIEGRQKVTFWKSELGALQALVTMISLHLTHSTTGGETAKKWITNFKIKMSQFIAQMFQAVPQHYYLLDTLVLQVNQSKTSPVTSTRKGTMARWCDIRRQILEFFVVQCALVKSGAVQSG